MKKILFTLVALMSIMTVQAQSICASWRSVEPDVETDEDGMAIEIATSISIKGTYTLEGDKLSMTPNMDTYKFELLSISQNGQVTSNPMVKAQVKSMFNSAEFKEQFAAAEECTVKVGDSMLEMNDGEKTYNYTRFATVQN